MSTDDLYDELRDLVAKQPVPMAPTGLGGQEPLGPADVLFTMPATGSSDEKGALRVKLVKKRAGIGIALSEEGQLAWPSK